MNCTPNHTITCTDSLTFLSNVIRSIFIAVLDEQASPTTSTLTIPPASSSSATKVGLKSFTEYKASKGKQWKSRVTMKSKKDKIEDVVIQVGLLEWNDRERKLKPKRGKRMALRVSLKDPYVTIRKKAIEKWKNYHRNLYDEEKEYILTYEDGAEAQFLPGTHSFFDLKSYREEIGKEYRRIVFFLCTQEDQTTAEKNKTFDYAETSSDTSEENARYESELIKNDEELAKQLQSQYDIEVKEEVIEVLDDSVPELESVNNAEDLQGDKQDGVLPSQPVNMGEEENNESLTESNLTDFIRVMAMKLDDSDQFFLVIRRNAKLSRKLSMWQREATKNSPEKTLRICFTGEAGIDSGALSREFLTQTIDEIGKTIFPNGIPADSMLNVHNGTFRTCGQITAVSIVEGGPPPVFLDECIFNMLVNPAVDMNNLNIDQHFTLTDKQQLDSIRKDPKTYEEFIIEHGYTGIINVDNADAIIGTVMISIISRRLLYLSEFLKGLELFGVAANVVQHPSIFKEAFVNTSRGKVDANYVVSLFSPVYSPEGSSRRHIEEQIVDCFQDFLIELEDNEVSGYTEAIAWKNQDEHNESEVCGSEECFQSADLTPAGILGWLTGQKHEPINGENLKITIEFDYNCMERNPCHKICFPMVGACGRQIRFPVVHMKTKEEFNSVFMTAVNKGQSFAKP